MIEGAPEAEVPYPARFDRRKEVEPLTAGLRRLHVTVGHRLLAKLEEQARRVVRTGGLRSTVAPTSTPILKEPFHR